MDTQEKSYEHLKVSELLTWSKKKRYFKIFSLKSKQYPVLKKQMIYRILLPVV